MIFETEQEAIDWVSLHTPFICKPAKKRKYTYVGVFTSGNARDQTIEHIGKELFKLTQKQAE